MKILIDCTQIPIEKVGVGVYAKETIMRMFYQKKSQDIIYLLLQDDEEMFNGYICDEIIPIYVNSKIFRKFPFRILLEQLYIPWLCKKYSVEVLHSLHYSFPLLRTSAKKIVTVHDMTFFLFPKTHTLVKRYYFKWFIKKCTKKADGIITVSKSTANDLKNIIQNIQCPIESIPLGVILSCVSNKVEHETKLRYNLPDDYICFIGTLEPRKNIERLIKAYSIIKKEIRHKLVIVGKKGWFFNDIFHLVETLNLIDDVIFTGYVTTEQKYSILKGAKMLVYPSIYEGFGIPVLEGMSQGVPVITSNISSMPEIAGNAAILIDPYNIEQLSLSIKDLIDNDNLRAQIIALGNQRIEKYTWDVTAKKTLDFYRFCL